MTPIALNRSILSDVWFGQVERQIFDLFQRWFAETAERRAVGMPMDSSAWLQEDILVKRPLFMGMISAGMELTRQEFVKGKTVETVGLGFDLEPTSVDLDNYLQQTGQWEVATTRKRVDKIVQGGLREGLTPPEIATELLRSGTILNRNRARMIARTSTIWSYNEGAHLTYKQLGVQVEEWIATADDRTCEFCLQMDGQKVKTNSPFAFGESEFEGLEGGILNIPIDVQHPPLHPYCRCTMIPVIG